MKIEVTRKHISDGLQGSCDSCPIALSVRDFFPTAAFVSVDSASISVTLQNGDWMEYDTPDDAAEFIRGFDLFYKMKPLSFEIKARFSSVG